MLTRCPGPSNLGRASGRRSMSVSRSMAPTFRAEMLLRRSRTGKEPSLGGERVDKRLRRGCQLSSAPGQGSFELALSRAFPVH